MDHKDLLIQKINKLSSLDLTQHIDLLDAASIIYQILLDSPALFDEVNKDVRYKLSFQFAPYSPPKINGHKMIATIAVIGEAKEKKCTLTREQFYKAAALRFGDKDLSVSELIKFYRNTKGGTHHDTKENKKSVGHQSLKKLSELTILNNNKIEGYDQIMKKVTQSVIEALRPFDEKIRE